jgi:hypothetical protein
VVHSLTVGREGGGRLPPPSSCTALASRSALQRGWGDTEGFVLAVLMTTPCQVVGRPLCEVTHQVGGKREDTTRGRSGEYGPEGEGEYGREGGGEYGRKWTWI